MRPGRGRYHQQPPTPRCEPVQKVLQKVIDKLNDVGDMAGEVGKKFADNVKKDYGKRVWRRKCDCNLKREYDVLEEFNQGYRIHV